MDRTASDPWQATLDVRLGMIRSLSSPYLLTVTLDAVNLLDRRAGGEPPLAIRFGGRLSFVIVMLGLTTWPQIARVVRAEVLALKEEPFVLSARAIGAGDIHLMFREILPNLVAPVIVYATLLIPLNILLEASLSFLGVGIPPPTADWGQMIADSQSVYQYGAWWYLVFPSLALLITTLAFNIFGDSVRDAFDPRGGQLFV